MRATAQARHALPADTLTPLGDEGLSLIEVMVSLLVLAVVMAAAASFFINSLRSTDSQGQRQIAVTLANQALEQTQSQTPAALLTGRTQSSVQALLATPGAAALTAQDFTSSGNYDPSPIGPPAIPTTVTQVANGTSYTIRTFIDICYLASGGGSCGRTSSAGATQLYRITVDVTWSGGKGSQCSGGCDYSASTIIDAHGEPTFKTNISTPHITGISPSAAAVLTTRTLTITGTGFVSGAFLQITGSAATFSPVTTNTGIQIVVDLTAGNNSGSYTLYVVNPDGGRASTSFTITPPPVITSISPSAGSPPGGSAVTVTGTGFQNGATMTMTGGSVSGVSWVSPTQMTATLTPDGSLEGANAATVTVTNPDFGVGSAGWTVNQSTPTITSVSPNFATVGVPKLVTISGSNFMTGGTLTMTNGTVSGLTYLSSSSLQATVTISAGASGTSTLTEANPDGGSATAVLTIIPLPAITSVSPNTAKQNISTSVTLTGTGFQAGATVTMTKGTILSSSVTSSTTIALTIKVSVGQSGTATFVVTNPDTGQSPPGGTLTIIAPTISGISSTTPPCCGGTSPFVTITGTNFVSGATVSVSGYSTAPTTRAGTSVTVNGPGTSVQFKYTVPSGSRSLTFTITNPDGSAASATFTINPQ